MFWPQVILGSVPGPTKMDLRYEIHVVFEHAAKFHGDQSRNLGERVAEQKNITGKIYASIYYRFRNMAACWSKIATPCIWRPRYG